MIKYYKTLFILISTIYLFGAEIRSDNDSNFTLSMNKTMAWAHYQRIGDCPVDECIPVFGTPVTRSSSPTINWSDMTADPDIAVLSASRDRAGTAESAYWIKYGTCLYLAETASISCKQDVAGQAVGGTLVCIAGGVIFTPVTGTVCAAVVAGATVYDNLSCERRLQDDKHFCRLMSGRGGN